MLWQFVIYIEDKICCCYGGVYNMMSQVVSCFVGGCHVLLRDVHISLHNAIYAINLNPWGKKYNH